MPFCFYEQLPVQKVGCRENKFDYSCWANSYADRTKIAPYSSFLAYVCLRKSYIAFSRGVWQPDFAGKHAVCGIKLAKIISEIRFKELPFLVCKNSLTLTSIWERLCRRLRKQTIANNSCKDLSDKQQRGVRRILGVDQRKILTIEGKA